MSGLEDIPEFYDDPQQPTKQDIQKYDNYNVSQFKNFGLKEELLRAVKEAGFEHPTRVQAESLTNALQGEQLICQAKAGTGKTAVFVLTVLNTINTESNKVECLVITHTRELAQQARDEFLRLGKFMKSIKVECFYGGGEPVTVNISTIETVKPQIVVGTPGRLKDLICEKKALKVDRLKYFILDEADTMIEDLNMRKDIQDIFLRTPQDKQFMAFSATFTESSRTSLKKFIADNKHIYEITIKPEQLFLDKLKQYYLKVPETLKFHYLRQILNTCKLNQCIIFVKSSEKADALVAELKKKGEDSVRQLYGGNRLGPDHQKMRQKTYEQFRNGHFRLLVATNLMGRGIDIDKVNYVINFDMPDSLETYLHRVGRAGRQETNGVAISFVKYEEETSDGKKQTDDEVLQQILKQYPDKLQQLPQDLSTLDKF
ncbi:unnamed protein product (macronuclear) [Paramecium tetraurelia]|uniref:RNA helicase n=1 Tax=Paramecium tetraurelia TaxID=5888 RepID=A0D6R6_PARTE|nr:uncharacterized protein GSPATT00001774001 [Paramecium tetraurelia]CAK78733.1 unnamed protein product [Paramecium tetraurelia]|eukprot:XP_001446130.1 hypothetical protein (macronuclear) [Paramecium tetraurelia strain d4-2]